MQIPKGYKLVPVEPTDEMLAAYERASIAPIGPISRHGYEAMLDAAPTPTQPIYDEAKERELFEGQFLVTPGRWESGYVDRSVNQRWKGWLACAQARAKSVEVGHE